MSIHNGVSIQICRRFLRRGHEKKRVGFSVSVFVGNRKKNDFRFSVHNSVPDIFMTSVPQFCQEYITSLVRRPVFSLVRLIIVRPWPCRLAPAAGESCGAHICPIPCTPIPLWSSSKCRNTPSTNQLHVFSFRVGRSVLLNKDYCLNTSSSSKFFGQGGNAWNLPGTRF